MPIPQTKSQLIEAITINSEKLKAEFKTIPVELSESKTMEGHAKGTSMSVCNLVSYLIGWGKLVLKWNDKKERGEIVDLPEKNYKWNELGKLAQKFYKDYENDSFALLIKKFEKVVARILKMIEQKSNKQLYEIAWYEKWTLGRMIQLNTSSPYQNAIARIRKWKKMNFVN